MTLNCPACGKPVDAVPAQALALSTGLSAHERKVVEALVAAYPRYVTGEFLLESVYGDRWDGGPDSNSLNVFMVHLRKKLPKYGWTIPSGKQGRGNPGRYRLQHTEEK